MRNAIEWLVCFVVAFAVFMAAIVFGSGCTPAPALSYAPDAAVEADSGPVQADAGTPPREDAGEPVQADAGSDAGQDSGPPDAGATEPDAAPEPAFKFGWSSNPHAQASEAWADCQALGGGLGTVALFSEFGGLWLDAHPNPEGDGSWWFWIQDPSRPGLLKWGGHNVSGSVPPGPVYAVCKLPAL